MQTLANWKVKAGDSYIAHLAYSFRSFELEPTDQLAASRLLSMIPPTKEEQSLWYTLDGFLCKDERENDLKALAALHARMPHDIARAVLRVPEKLPDYISYAFESVQDPSSDYVLQMRSVCRARHKAFVAAVDSLTLDERQWFLSKIFSPNDCRAIAMLEAN